MRGVSPFSFLSLPLFKKLLIGLFAANFILNGLDMLSTWLDISVIKINNGLILKEGNPIMAYLMNNSILYFTLKLFIVPMGLIALSLFIYKVWAGRISETKIYGFLSGVALIINITLGYVVAMNFFLGFIH